MIRKKKGWFFRVVVILLAMAAMLQIILSLVKHFLGNNALLVVDLLILGICVFFFIVAIRALTRAKLQRESLLKLGYQIVSNELELEKLSEQKPVVLVTQSASPGAGEFNALLIFEKWILPSIASCIVDNKITIAWGNVGSFLHQSNLDSFFDKRSVKKRGCYLISDKHILKQKTLGPINQASAKKIVTAVQELIANSS